jgi:hypothetical protein
MKMLLRREGPGEPRINTSEKEKKSKEFKTAPIFHIKNGLLSHHSEQPVRARSKLTRRSDPDVWME